MRDVTIKDIADRIGISHSTVSRALRDHPLVSAATKTLVREVADQLGYIANSGARMLSRTQSELLGVVFPDVTNDFYSQTMSTLSAAFLAQGYKLVLAVSEDDPQVEHKQIQSLREARVAGVVIAPTAAMLPETARLLESVPTVQLLRRHPLLDCGAIQIDEPGGIAQAVEYLAGRGHVRIGYIGGFGALSTGAKRAEGYVDALALYGLPLDGPLMHQGPPRPYFGHEAMAGLLALHQPPTAVIVASSELTLGALEAIQQHQVSVPGDLALIAYHDPSWFKLWGAGITCIRLPIDTMAQAAARRLLDQIHGKSGEPGQRAPDHAPGCTSSQFETQLVIRGSA